MKNTLALAVAALLAACGGSSDSSPNPGEPNDTFAQATPIAIGTPVVATISADGELDYYEFTVPLGGATVRFQTFDRGGTACDPSNRGVDPSVVVYDGSQQWVAADEDGGLQPYCEDVTVSLAGGTNYVLVTGWDPTPFVYTLELTFP